MAYEALNAADQWTTVQYRVNSQGYSISITGTLSPGLVLQRRQRGNSNAWNTVFTFTSLGEYDGDFGGANEIRVGYPAGSTVSGTVNVNVY